MQSSQFDNMTRQVRTLDRKTTLKALGGTFAAAALARPMVAEAKKNKKWKKKCKKQVSPCKSFWDNYCGGEQSCRDYYHNCCDFLKKCKGSKYFNCTFVPESEA